MYQQLRFKGLKQFQSDDKRREDNRRTIEQDIYFVNCSLLCSLLLQLLHLMLDDLVPLQRKKTKQNALKNIQ